MQREKSALPGVWALRRAEYKGETAPEAVVQQTEIEFTDRQYVVRFAGNSVDEGTYHIAIHGIEGELVLHSLAGANAGRTIPCIFQLSGDRLRVCFGFDGTRPSGFVTAEHLQSYVGFYRRRARTSDAQM